ncbi:hypothetical protein [Nocardioides sp. Leaf285]|uniref:hypothetical protein n=1 Tax=Nocardioides sp. Leaf285 TaxID=1736322 RepID=UPI0007035351|nr:hypothetical protein [Nocardioides sp. Leaf285]KQP62946.1 hypothetical protein ASF47_18205 [Nocardioides sp. Leaf285]
MTTTPDPAAVASAVAAGPAHVLLGKGHLAPRSWKCSCGGFDARASTGEERHVDDTTAVLRLHARHTQDALLDSFLQARPGFPGQRGHSRHELALHAERHKVENLLAEHLGYQPYPPGSPGYSDLQVNYVVGDHDIVTLVKQVLGSRPEAAPTEGHH